MKNAKIVLVAEWDGWCAACAADRPLVLTRTGRQRLRTWLTAAADDSRPLTLTCRLCGTGVDVPLEHDDPPVVDSDDDAEASEFPSVVAAAPTAAVEAVAGEVVTAEVVASDVVTAELVAAVPAPLPAPLLTAAPAELTAGRQAVAQALGALVAQRRAAPAVAPVLQSAAVAVLAPAVPMQRTPSSGGLAELQLLADGIDLLSTGRD